MKISSDTFEILFPFHVEVGPDSRISGLGRSIQKTCPELQIGQAFDEAFSPFRPPEAFNLEELRSRAQTLFVINAQDSGLSLRGQIVPTDDRGFVFLGSPWFSDSSELSKRGLTVEDFAIHDPAVDLLHILRAQQMATGDLKKLTEKLRGQRTQLKEANARLIEQEAEQRRLALIAERTDNGVILTDVQGRTQWVNAGFTRLTGYTLAEVSGKVPGHFLQGPGTNPKTVSFIRAQIKERKPFRAEILNYHKSGRRYWVAFEVQPLFNDQGELLHFMAIENDTTAQRTAEANRRAQFQVSQLLTQASDVDSVANELLATIGSELFWDGGLLWMAQDGESTLKPISHWIQSSPAKTPRVSKNLTQMDNLAGAAWKQEKAIWIEELEKAASDSPRIQELHGMGFRSAVAVPIRIAGNVLGVLELFGRLKEPKDREREQVLIAISSQVAQFFERTQSEKALKSRSEELIRLNKDLSAASAAKDKFLASISHEIRTPLNGVIGAADSLEITRLDQDQKEALSTISASASHLHSLLNDVLDLSRIEAGRLELSPEPTVLQNLVDETVRMFQPIAHQKRLQFEISSNLPASLCVAVDQTRLRQVLVNLLGNAFKFTPKGKVELKIRCHSKDQHSYLDFFVVDSGIGIPADQVGQLFEPFHQLDSSRTKKFGGTGLGLSICRQLVELMHGEITLESTGKPGSTFRVSLKLPQAQAPSENPRKAPPLPLPGPILMVDDNHTNARVLKMMLKQVGIRVHHCEHAVDAMAYCTEIEPPIILMDLHMPDIDGMQATQMLREDVLINTQRHVPIIALTADVRPEAKQGCLDAGMDGFLSKPIRLEDLLRTLQKYFGVNADQAVQASSNDTHSVTTAFPVVDFEFSDRIFDEQADSESLNELASIFNDAWKSLEPALDKIATWQNSKDIEKGQSQCHAVRGIASNFGLTEAAELLREMEYEKEAFLRSENIQKVRASLESGYHLLMARYPFLNR